MTGSTQWPTGLLRTSEIAGSDSIRRALASLDAEGRSLWLVERAGTLVGLVSPAPDDLVATRIGEQALAAALVAAASRAPNAAAPRYPVHHSANRRPDGDGRRRPPVSDTPQPAATPPRSPHPVVDPADTRRPLPTSGDPGETTGIGRTKTASAWNHASAGPVAIEIPGSSRLRLAAMAGIAPASRREPTVPRPGGGSHSRSDSRPPGSVAGPGSAPATLDADATDAGGHGAAPARNAPTSSPGDAPVPKQNGLTGLVHLWQDSAGEHATTSGHRPPGPPDGGRAAFAPPGVVDTSTPSWSPSIAGADRGVAGFTAQAASGAVSDLEAEAQLLELLERALRGEARRLGVDLDHGGLL